MNRHRKFSTAGHGAVLVSVRVPSAPLFHNMLDDYFWRARTVHTSIRLMDRLEDQKTSTKPKLYGNARRGGVASRATQLRK